MSYGPPHHEARTTGPGGACDRRRESVLEHAGAVERMAHQMARQLRHRVDVEDLIQAGMLGLLEAAARYKPRMGAEFRSFSYWRIQGAMMDFVRKCAWGSRLSRQRQRVLAAAVARIECETGEAARAPAIAERLGVSVDDVHRVNQARETERWLSLEALLDVRGARLAGAIADANLDPAESAMLDEGRWIVEAAIAALPDRERRVIRLHYHEDLLFREIGDMLDVTEGRVSQLHKSAIERMRRRVCASQWSRGAALQIDRD